MIETTGKQLESLALLRGTAREQLLRNDKKMRRQWLLALGVQMLHFVIILAIPLVVILPRESPNLILLVTMVSGIAAALGLYQYAFNPQARWAQ